MRPSRRILLATDDGRDVRCRCGGRMRPEAGRDLEARVTWLWWRCETDPLHITAGIPLPEDLADRAGVGLPPIR